MDTSGYGNKWLKAEEYNGKGTLRAEILDEAVKQKVGDKDNEQLVCAVRMDDTVWKIGINVGNWKNITAKYGMDSMKWVGKWITMTAVERDFGGTLKWGWEMQPTEEVEVENVPQ